MIEFRMPSLGADMEAGTLVEWLKKPGDAVRRGDIVAVVETQKGAIEVEIFDDGVIDWATTLMTLQKVGYTGTLMMELAASAEGAAATLARAARARQRLESVLGEELRF